MTARDLMTSDPTCCTPDDTLEAVAGMMRESDCGAIPVCQSRNPGEVVGIVTDRDLAVRGLAQGCGPDTTVRECMSDEVHGCGPDSSAEDVQEIMTHHRIRRVPIIDPDGHLLGIVSQADLARAARAESELDGDEVAAVIEVISRPQEA